MQRRLDGKPVKALIDRPQLSELFQPYLEAFFRLNKRRQYTMGSELPLSFTEIERFSVRFGFDTDFSFFYRCIEECDEEYFAHLSEKRKNEPKGKSAGKLPGPRKRPPRRR